MTDKKEQGKKNLEAGRRFELKVRKDLEEKGWIVSKWQNNVDLTVSIDLSQMDPNKKILGRALHNCPRLVPAKQGRFRKTSTGFPDFICYNLIFRGGSAIVDGVECKSNGYLSKDEKEKCKWLLQNKVFSQIFIAKKGKKRGEIIYEEFKC